MNQPLKEQFIAKLEERYGIWKQMTSKFGTSSFGAIAKDLSISISQFSKLISGNATEGMYTRSIDNINRLIHFEKINEEKDLALAAQRELEKKVSVLKEKDKKSKTKTLLLLGLAFLLGSFGMYFFKTNSATIDSAPAPFFSHPLSDYFDLDFDSAFDSPYLRASEVQEYCPCSAYEGIWSLSEEYKLPIPGNKKPGVYYKAKSADVRMKCSKIEVNSKKGNVLWAYEYLTNEIWVDTKMTPLSPKYFDKQSKSYTSAFQALTFEENPQFKKVATIHSFFVDKFEIYPDSIIRKGEPCGRFATDVDEVLASQFEIDPKHILENVLGDLNKTACQAAKNPFCDPNDLREQESVISFDCIYTIKSENLGIGGGYPYQKGYRLEKQNYSANLTCSCGESLE